MSYEANALVSGALEAGARWLPIFASQEPFDKLAEVTNAQHAADERLLGFVNGLPDDVALGRAVTLPRDDGPQLDRVRDVLAHLVVHQIHHRGLRKTPIGGYG